MWIFRGLRNGLLTSRYPRRSDPYADAFPAAVDVLTPDADPAGLVELCPTGAIQPDPDGEVSRVKLDRGRCILCGTCVRTRPDVFGWSAGSQTASLHRQALIVPERPETAEELTTLRAQLATRVRRLGRSIHLRHVDAGSDGADEWEVLALFNPVYDAHRLGIFLTASPRHADILLATGVGTPGMAAPLARTLDGMPRPAVVIATGVDAISGGLAGGGVGGGDGVGGEGVGGEGVGGEGVGGLVPVDVWVPGSPASPFSLLHAILLALGRLPEAVTA
jgi:Ni,Fe-hydrogenase III small subunit/ferredoxin